MRSNNRQLDELREIKIIKGFTGNTPGSVLFSMGNTKILCTASVEESVPHFLMNSGKGWVTAEYGMLPGSTSTRKPRTERKGKLDGRTFEIQRLIGRALRGIVDLELLGERTIWLDCDVLQADGGTRTASISGAFIALSLIVESMVKEQRIFKSPILGKIAAVSLGIVKGQKMLDLDYSEDSRADVDMNIVMNDKFELIELQGSSERQPFSQDDLGDMLTLAKKGVSEIFKEQEKVCGKI